MKNTAKWMKKLTVREILHVKDATRYGTFREFVESRKKNPPCDCMECRMIGRKLKLEV